jgi:hypothetical protein
LILFLEKDAAAFEKLLSETISCLHPDDIGKSVGLAGGGD